MPMSLGNRIIFIKNVKAKTVPRRPSRYALRQANSSWSEIPCRRAIADASRGAGKLSSTIRSFSAADHRRRRPVSTISSHLISRVSVGHPYRQSATSATIRQDGLNRVDTKGRNTRAIRWPSHCPSCRSGGCHASCFSCHVCRKVRERRAILGWSQRELGARVSMTQKSIYRVEQGTHNLRRSTILTVEQVLKAEGIEFEKLPSGGFKVVVPETIPTKLS